MGEKVIIGITGTLGAGKGTIVDYLQKRYNFNHFSASEFITEEILRRNLEVNRDSMREVANDLREKNSPSYVAEELYLRAGKTKNNAIIESLRTLGEINSLKEKGNFYLFAVDADSKIRYERILLRKSSKDNVSFEKFIQNEKAESLNEEPHKQNLPKCINQADFKFNNDCNFENLYKQIDEVMRKIVNG
ncbi:MAG: AAA family ATPase [Candidatus Woesearchaeota archaeon]|jgi:dephospho-CoA kinase|nr:AAA family ATPase [Candidatus Woesearchaeota archaeon]